MNTVQIKSPYAATQTPKAPPRIVIDPQEGQQIAAENAAWRRKVGMRAGALAVLATASCLGGNAWLAHLERRPPNVALALSTDTAQTSPTHRSPDGRLFAVPGRQGELQVRNADGSVLATPTTDARSVAWLGQNLLAWSDFQGTVTAWDASTQTVRWTRALGQESRYRDFSAKELTASPDGRFLVSTWGSQMHVLNAATGDVVADRETYRGGRISFVANGSILSMQGHRSTVLLSTDNWEPMGPTWSGYVAVSNDGQRVAVSQAEAGVLTGGRVRVHDARSGSLVSEFTTWYGTQSVPAFSPDGSRIAVTTWSGNSGELIVADANSGEVQWKARTARGSAPPVFSADGGTVLGATPKRCSHSLHSHIEIPNPVTMRA